MSDWSSTPTTIEELRELVVAFRDQRDWKQFHTPRNMAISLSLESSELLEIFQWSSDEDLKGGLSEEITEKVGAELADVLYWVLLMSHDLGLDLSSTFIKKLQLNREKYPIEKAHGSSKKYTEL